MSNLQSSKYLNIVLGSAFHLHWSRSRYVGSRWTCSGCCSLFAKSHQETMAPPFCLNSQELTMMYRCCSVGGVWGLRGKSNLSCDVETPFKRNLCGTTSPYLCRLMRHLCCVQTPSRIPENRESCRTLMAEPVPLSTNTDTYSPAWIHKQTLIINIVH